MLNSRDHSGLKFQLRHFLILSLCLTLGAPSGILLAEGKFADDAGNEVILPKDLPIFSRSKPGVWAENIPDLQVEIEHWIRKEGLEDIRVLYFMHKTPFKKNDTDYPLEAIYFLDKDNAVISYQKYDPNFKGMAEGKFFVNGVINRIHVYVQYKDLGLWKQELEFSFQKS